MKKTSTRKNRIDKMIQRAKDVIKDREEAMAICHADSVASCAYLEGVEDGIAGLLSQIFPELGGMADIKEMLTESK